MKKTNKSNRRVVKPNKEAGFPSTQNGKKSGSGRDNAEKRKN